MVFGVFGGTGDNKYYLLCVFLWLRMKDTVLGVIATRAGEPSFCKMTRNYLKYMGQSHTDDGLVRNGKRHICDKTLRGMRQVAASKSSLHVTC